MKRLKNTCGLLLEIYHRYEVAATPAAALLRYIEVMTVWADALAAGAL